METNNTGRVSGRECNACVEVMRYLFGTEENYKSGRNT